MLLYLAQEGRGIGLVNKLRAYQLQDAGFDTIDANEQLGFDADERVYLPAAEMLRQLGFATVRLLTNNPDKVAALQRYGIARRRARAARLPGQRPQRALSRHQGDPQRPLAVAQPLFRRRHAISLPGAEDRGADADMGRAEADRGLEIGAHPHAQPGEPVAPRDLAQQREMQRRLLVLRRHAHQPDDRQPEPVAAIAR